MTAITPNNTLNIDSDSIPNSTRVQRKTLVTVAEWTPDGASTASREILGCRTEDSSIETNPDIETMTDILGITHTDVNKTEPQQDFDPYYLVKNSELGAYLATALLYNDIDAYNGTFTVYVITAFLGSSGAYTAVKHTGCSIIPTSIGGSNYVSMPIEVHLSNNITKGTVDKLGDDFKFTEAS